jgi:O-antigen/teichoic acid export membrane protein
VDVTAEGMEARAPPPRRSRPTFASAAFTTYAATIGAAVLSLANVLITSRALGPTGRGEFAFLTTVALLASALASLGIEEANGNLAAIVPGARRALASNSLVLAVVLGGAAAGIVALVIALAPAAGAGSDPKLRLLAFAAIPLFILQIYLQFLIRADYGFAVTNFASVIGPVITLSVNSVLAAMGLLTVGTALGAWVGAQAIGTGVLVWYVARRLAGFGRPGRRLAREALGFGIKSHAGRVMKTGNYRLDQWLLGAMAGSRELGLYSVAVAWSESLYFLPEALAMVLRPDVVRASAVDAARRTATVFRLALLVSIPFVIGLVVAAPLLCVVAFGEEFRGSIDDLRALAPGGFGIVALKLLANALVAQRKPMLANLALGVALAATIGLDVVLIPRYGGLGAAIASTLSYSAGGLIVAVIFVRALGIRLGDLVPRRQDLAMLPSRVVSRRSS